MPSSPVSTAPPVSIKPLAAADPAAVEALLDAAFGTDRHRRTAYRLREGCAWLPPYSLAAFDAAGLLCGSLQIWPIALASGESLTPLLLVGPVAVAPAHQRGGIGRTMMTQALAAMEAAGEPASLLIGDADYYGRFFGYDAAPTRRWIVPGPVERERLLARVAPGVMLPADGALVPRPQALAA